MRKFNGRRFKKGEDEEMITIEKRNLFASRKGTRNL
jgi:hypothetical protein